MFVCYTEKNIIFIVPSDFQEQQPLRYLPWSDY